MTIDRNKVRKSVAEYVYFLLDSEPKCEAYAAAYDSRRHKLHNAIYESMSVEFNCLNDTHIADGINDMTVPVEEYIDFHTDGVISNVYNRKILYDGMELRWATKEQIQQMLKDNKERINNRINEVNRVMERAVNGLDDWNNDHPTDKKLYPWNVGINTHEWNGLRADIYLEFAKIEALAEMPRESYTKILVTEYRDKPLATIEVLLNKLEGIAFRTERTKYYTYTSDKKDVD